MGVRIVRAVGTLILARLLTPYDFGVIAFGATLVVFANFLADGGIGAGLVRRIKPPERRELRALLGFQLVSVRLWLLSSASLCSRSASRVR